MPRSAGTPGGNNPSAQDTTGNPEAASKPRRSGLKLCLANAEIRAWQPPVALNAGRLHGDFEQGAKEADRWRLEGNTHVIEEGDVIHFRFNV